MRVFISGGCKNGKSSHAQRIAKKMQQNNGLYYLATMVAKDDEDEQRILRHQQERAGWGFETIELAENLCDAIRGCDASSTFLLDSTTALLANEMFSGDSVNHNACKKIAAELKQILYTTNNIVIVSDYIYSDAFIYDDLTEEYRKGLAYIDKTAASACDVVLEACYGSLFIHKGKSLFEEFYNETD